MNIANAYLDRGDYKAAVKAFKKVLKREPGHLPAKIGLATFLEKDGKDAWCEWAGVIEIALGRGETTLAERVWEKVAESENLDKDGWDCLRAVAWSLEAVQVLDGLTISDSVESVKGASGGGGVLKGGGLGGESIFSKRQEGEREETPLDKLEAGAKAVNE